MMSLTLLRLYSRVLYCLKQILDGVEERLHARVRRERQGRRLVEPGERELHDLVAVDRVANRPADVLVGELLPHRVETKADRPPVHVAVRRLVVAGDDLLVLRLNQLHVRRRQREGHVDLVRDEHLGHRDLVHSRQEDRALDLRQRLEAGLDAPPVRVDVPDLLLDCRADELPWADADRPALVGVVELEGLRVLALPDVLGHREQPDVGAEREGVEHKLRVAEVERDLEVQVVNDGHGLHPALDVAG